MIFHGPLTDAKICCNVFARVARKNHFHDLLLPRCKRLYPFCSIDMPGGSRVFALGFPQRSFNALEKLGMIDRLFDNQTHLLS